MAAQRIREKTIESLSALGFPAPPDHLPVVDDEGLRSQTEIVDRALALNVVINRAYRMPAELARKWLGREGLEGALTAAEAAFLGSDALREDAETGYFAIQVEALWALAWALGLEQELDFGHYCGDHLADLLPDLRGDESRAPFDAAAQLRPCAELHASLDLAYCLTWGAREAGLRRQPLPGSVEEYVLWERRRALEYIFGADWDDPPMDT